MASRVQRMGNEGRYFFMAHANKSQNVKGKAIINGAGGFDEINGEIESTAQSLEAEISHIAHSSNFQIKSQIGVEVDDAIECECCFWENQIENIVQCQNGHRFCFKCIGKRLDEIIYGGFKAVDYLSCMSTIDPCNASILLSEIKKVLPNDIIDRYDYRQAQQAIVEAQIENLVYCPFCNIPYEIDKCLQVLDCPNPKCLIATCLQCKKLSHFPLGCQEADKKSETALIREVEERMTKAVIRECNMCNAGIIKTYGCNKVKCRCGNRLCNVCRQAISYIGFHHFCCCGEYNGEPGKQCKRCNKCSLIENEIEDDEAVAARDEALKELVVKKPELLDVEIGPPLKRRRRPPPSEEQGHPYGIFGDNFGSMAGQPQVPMQQSFGLVDQFGNMAVPPQVAIPRLRLANGDEPVNMVTPPSPEPYFLTFDDGDQPVDMDFQAQQDDGRQEDDSCEEELEEDELTIQCI